MRKKKIRQSQYTGKDTNTTSPLPNLPSASNTISCRYYQHINQLPLNRFIDIVVDGNLYALVISGEPTREQLLIAWDDIRLQYADAMKDAESKLFYHTEKELNRLKITYYQIQQAIDLLRKYYTVQFHKILNDLLKTSFKLDVRFPDDYEKDLKAANNRSKGIKIEMDLKQLTYDAMRKKFEGTKAPTREYYQGLLITLSDFVKYEIRDTITVFEFCDRIRRVNQFNEQQKLKPNGKR